MIQQPLVGQPGIFGSDFAAPATTVVAPAATTTITSVVLPTQGKQSTYKVRCRYGYTAGVPVAADANNWRLIYLAAALPGGGTLLISPMAAASSLVAAGIFTIFEFTFSDQGVGGTLALQSIGNGTAGVAYTADMEVTRLS